VLGPTFGSWAMRAGDQQADGAAMGAASRPMRRSLSSARLIFASISGTVVGGRRWPTTPASVRRTYDPDDVGGRARR
jgi:hypothetical protein